MNDNTTKIDSTPICKDLQNQVSKVLIRHKSILDILTKLDQYNARINRALAKSVTNCGCISINATKQDYDKNSLEEMLNSVNTHIEGELCDNCKDVMNEEIGSYIFYLAALCNVLNLDLEQIIKNEYNTIKTLGIYSLK